MRWRGGPILVMGCGLGGCFPPSAPAPFHLAEAATTVTAAGECGAAPGGTGQWICGPGQHGGAYALVGITVKIERARDSASFIEMLRRWQ